MKKQIGHESLDFTYATNDVADIFKVYLYCTFVLKVDHIVYECIETDMSKFLCTAWSFTYAKRSLL